MKKPLIVQKFGGTSMGSIERIELVAQHIIDATNAGNQVVVVVSAMAGETNRLMDLAKQVDPVPMARELDVLLAAGEQMSMALLAMTLNKLGYAARSLTGGQAKILTNDLHNDATIEQIDASAIEALIDENVIAIVAGFQGVTAQGDITTLGRGGSDTSAVVLAGALGATECQIFTDVDGVYTSDPRVVTTAQKLPIIDFPSMEAMANYGAKVLHLPSVKYAWSHNIPLRVLSTFELNAGSLVKGKEASDSVVGLALLKDVVAVTVKAHQWLDLQHYCRMMGIDVFCHIIAEDVVTFLIKQDAFAKLELVFASNIHNSEKVSMLTLVGAQASRVVNQARDLLVSHNIVPSYVTKDELTALFTVAPESLNRAANALHDAYVVGIKPTFHAEIDALMGEIAK